jgi:hypothetical protein
MPEESNATIEQTSNNADGVSQTQTGDGVNPTLQAGENPNNNKPQMSMFSKPVDNSQEKSFLPEGYRDDPAFKDYNDLDSVLKSYKEQQKLIGKKSIVEGLSSPEEYKFEEFEYPKELDSKIRDGVDKFTQELAYNSKLTPEQAKAVNKAFHEATIKEEVRKKEAAKEVDTKFSDYLKEAWGDNADANMKKTMEYFKGRLGNEAEKNMFENLTPEAQAFMAKKIFEVGNDVYNEHDSAYKAQSSPQYDSNTLRQQRMEKMKELSKYDGFDPRRHQILEEIKEIDKKWKG